VTGVVAAAPLLEEWPECRQVLLERLAGEPSWALALPGLSCAAVGGELTDAVPITAAWAILHQAATILDAVQDGDDTLPDEIDSPVTAISFATGLIFAALRFLDAVETYPGANHQISGLFSEAGFRSSLGQHLSLAQGWEGMPVAGALEAYWRAVICKSGSIFRAATAGGAAAGTASERPIAALGRFGTCLGVILQVLDDCRDVMAGSDIAGYEVSLPLLLLSMNAENDETGGQEQGAGIPDPGTPLSKNGHHDLPQGTPPYRHLDH
jgi:geranylgeranyl pyrophosphate synthase